MTKYIVSLAVVGSLLFAPVSFAQAQTVNKAQLEAQYVAVLQQLIQMLTQQLVALQKQLADQMAREGTTTTPVQPNSTSTLGTPTTTPPAIIETLVFVPVPQPVEVAPQQIQPLQVQQKIKMSLPQTFTNCKEPALSKGPKACASKQGYFVSDSINSKLRQSIEFVGLSWSASLDYQLYDRIDSIAVTEDPNDQLSKSQPQLISDTLVRYELTPSLETVFDAAIAANSGDGAYQQLQNKKVEFLQQMSEYGVQ